MSDLKDWANTAAGNDREPVPDYAPQLATPVASVDDIVRELQAAIRRWYELPGYRDLGDAVTLVDPDTLQVSGDQSLYYVAGQRVKVTDATTIYGTITGTSVVGGPNTNIDIDTDQGEVFTAPTAIAVGLDVTGNPAGAQVSPNITNQWTAFQEFRLSGAATETLWAIYRDDVLQFYYDLGSDGAWRLHRADGFSAITVNPNALELELTATDITYDGTSLITGGPAVAPAPSLQSMIINGSMQVWQVKQQFTHITSRTLAADCWVIQTIGAIDDVVVSQGPVSAIGSYMQMLANAPLTPRNTWIYQPIEGAVFRPFFGNTNTFGFTVKTTIPGTFTAVFLSANGKQYIKEYTINPGQENTDIAFVFQVPMDGSGGIETYNFDNTKGCTFGIFINGTPGTGTEETWEDSDSGNPNLGANQTNFMASVTNVFILHSVSCLFGTYSVMPTLGETFEGELEKSQRYYQKTFPYANPVQQNGGTPGALYSFYLNDGTYNHFNVVNWHFAKEMRSDPTFTTYNPLSANNQFAGSGGNTFLTNQLQGDTSGVSYNPGSQVLFGSATDYLGLHITADARLT